MTPRRRPPTTEMRVEPWPIDRVTPYAANPRKNSGAVAKVAASIREFGWRQPIVVDEAGVVIVQRWESATGQEATRP